MVLRKDADFTNMHINMKCYLICKFLYTGTEEAVQADGG
jgi:hypothetical protein